jgi:hypothetical protein
MTPLEIILSSAAVLGTVAGSYKASHKGGKEGSAGALNGTAEAVRRIETGIGRIDGKLDGHVVQTAENFRELSDRVSNIEGRLGDETPKRAMRAPRKRLQ